jgi:hypothetical protein
VPVVVVVVVVVDGFFLVLVSLFVGEMQIDL